MKFLLDVNTGGALATHLLNEGHDVELVSRIDLSMSDDDILRWAVRENRIIVTTDSDFDQMVWLRQQPHSGILRLENLPRSERMQLFKEVLANHSDLLINGAIIIATQRKIRIRKQRSQ